MTTLVPASKIDGREAALLEGQEQSQVVIRGGRCAIGPAETMRAAIEISGGRITNISGDSSLPVGASAVDIDLSGFLVMPGLVNAHDHLEFSLFPRLADPPYRNYIDWGTDIHNKFPDVIAKHRSVPKELRLWWGGIRNLLGGATTVSHHNPLWPALQREDFPVRVVQEYGWGHSLALGGDLRAARSVTPEGRAFIVHACEGIDEATRRELWELDRLELLDDRTVLVHGLAIDNDGVALMRDRGASLIVCPSSNKFLFGVLPDLSLLGAIENLALGNDSPLTAQGDLLDEIRFATRFCNISAQAAYRMVTEAPATILRLRDGEGSIKISGVGDLIAVRDTGHDAADMLATLSMSDIEFAMVGGSVQLASEAILERLPLSVHQELELLVVDGTHRWLRAPVKDLLRETEEALGRGEVRLGDKSVSVPA
jgi:cytosine/adenosine deaminase-related metal-dependent hydrolase